MTFWGETEFLPLPPRMDYKANNLKELKYLIEKLVIEWFKIYFKISGFTLTFYITYSQHKYLTLLISSCQIWYFMCKCKEDTFIV